MLRKLASVVIALSIATYAHSAISTSVPAECELYQGLHRHYDATVDAILAKIDVVGGRTPNAQLHLQSISSDLKRTRNVFSMFVLQNLVHGQGSNIKIKLDLVLTVF